MLIDGKKTTMEELLTVRDNADITEKLLSSKGIFIIEKGEILKISHIRIFHTEGNLLAYFERNDWIETRLCKYSDLGIKWGFTEDA